jgi:hypothetical protein
MEDIFDIEPADDAVSTPPTPAVLEDDPVAQVAAQAVAVALERTAFLAAEPSDGVFEAPSELQSISLDFGGPVPGRLELLVDLSIGRKMVAAALGVDEAAPEVDAGSEDALKELVNVAGGAMMPDLVHLFMPDEELTAICPLSLPHLAPADPSVWNIDPDRSSALLEVDEMPLLVRVHLAAPHADAA